MSPSASTLRTPARGSTFADVATFETQALTFATSRAGLPSVPSVLGMLTHDALSVREAVCWSSPSDTETLRATRAFAARAARSASAVVMVGAVSTNVTVAVVGARSRAEVAMTSWKLSGATRCPSTAATATNDFLSDASFTPASLPARSVCSTSSVATAAVLAGSVVHHRIDVARGDQRGSRRTTRTVGGEHGVDGGVDVDGVAEVGEVKGAGVAGRAVCRS